MRALILSIYSLLALLAGAYRPSFRHEHSRPTLLQAKKSSGQREGKGFAAQQKTLFSDSEQLQMEKMPPMTEVVTGSSDESSDRVIVAENISGSPSSGQGVKQGTEQEVDAVFKKYGITGEKKEPAKKKVSHASIYHCIKSFFTHSYLYMLCRSRRLLSKRSNSRARR